MQMATIVQEIGDKSYSLVFDGTPYRCECFGIGIFFADDKEQVGDVPSFFVSDKLNIDGRLTHVHRRAGAVNDKLMSYIFLTCNRFSRYSPPPGSVKSFLSVSKACWRTINMDAKDIVGEIYKVVVKTFKLDESRCCGIMGVLPTN